MEADLYLKRFMWDYFVIDTELKLIEEVIATERKWAEAHRTLGLDRIATILSDGYQQIQAEGSCHAQKWRR